MSTLDPAVVIGRLQKKITKLQKQRDFFSQRCTHYAEVVRLHSYMERTYKSVQEARNERERVRGLEQRIKEQAMLIAQLTTAGSPQERREG